MKIHQIKIILTIIGAATLVVTSCGKQTAETSGGNPIVPAASTVDTSKLQSAFESADAETKSAVDAIVTAIKGADYSNAVRKLQELAGKFKLTPMQQQAVNDTVANVQKEYWKQR